METEIPNSGTMNGMQNSNSEGYSKVIYNYQRVAHKQYLRVNYSLPDNDGLLKNELNSSIGSGNYSEFYWRWRALTYGKKDKFPYHKILIFILEQLFANPDNDDYQSLTQYHFHLTQIIYDCIKKGLQGKPSEDKLHIDFIFNMNVDIIFPCFLLICKINEKDESIQLKNLVNVISDNDKIDDFPIALAKNIARKVLTFWRIIIRVTVKLLLSSRMKLTKPLASYHVNFIKTLSKMVSRICEKQKKDQTIEDLFVITEISKTLLLFYRKGFDPSELNSLTEEVVNFIVKWPTLACSYFHCADDLVDIYINYVKRIHSELEKDTTGQQKLYQHRWALSQILMAINFENEAYEDFSLLTKLNQIEFQKKLERLLSLLAELGCKSLLENYLTKDNFKHFLLSVDIFSQFPNKGIRNLPSDKDGFEIQRHFSESFQSGLDLKNFEVVLIHTQKATLHRDLFFSFLNKSKINFQIAEEINQDIIKRILQNYELQQTNQDDSDYAICVLRLILRCPATSLPKDYPILQLISKIMKSLSFKWDSLKSFVEFLMGKFASYVQRGSMRGFEQAKVIYESLIQIVEEHCEQFKSIEQIFSTCFQKNEEAYLDKLTSFLELHYLIAALFTYVNSSNAIGAGLSEISEQTLLYVPRIFCEACRVRNSSVPLCVTFLTSNQLECCDFCGKIMRQYTLEAFYSGLDVRNISGFLQDMKNLHKKLITKIKAMRNAKKAKLKENYGSDITNIWNLFFNKEFQFYNISAELNAFYDADQGPLD